MLESGVDPEAIQSAWENLETARHILQKRLEEGVLGEEEKKAVLNKLAIIYSRIGDCECWQDKFKEAVEAYQHSLLLREQFENPSTSRPIAETYFMIGNAMVYEHSRPAGCSPIDYYLKASTILENILMEKYEKAGIEILIDPKEQVKKQLIVDRAGDDSTIKDIKGTLNELYQRIEDTRLEEKIKAEYEAVKKRQEEENKQALNAFGKPIEETGEKKVKNLGVFGKFLLISR
jgi:tetratricopeptide (TPR) repeat protein